MHEAMRASIPGSVLRMCGCTLHPGGRSASVSNPNRANARSASRLSLVAVVVGGIGFGTVVFAVDDVDDSTDDVLFESPFFPPLPQAAMTTAKSTTGTIRYRRDTALPTS